MDDMIKFIIAVVVVLAVALGLGYISDGFTNWDIKTWFDFGNTVSESVITLSDNPVFLG